MLQNAYLLAKIGADTAENEQHFAEILLKIGNYRSAHTGRAVPEPRGPGPAGEPGPAMKLRAQQEKMQDKAAEMDALRAKLSVPKARKFVFLTCHACKFAYM